jgi:hypothetical protein
MVPAQRGLLIIGGKGYNGEFLNDVLHVGLSFGKRNAWERIWSHSLVVT